MVFFAESDSEVGRVKRLAECTGKVGHLYGLSADEMVGLGGMGSLQRGEFGWHGQFAESASKIEPLCGYHANGLPMEMSVSLGLVQLRVCLRAARLPYC